MLNGQKDGCDHLWLLYGFPVVVQEAADVEIIPLVGTVMLRLAFLVLSVRVCALAYIDKPALCASDSIDCVLVP